MDPDGDIGGAGAGLVLRGEGEVGLATGTLDTARGEDEVVFGVGGLMEDELREILC